MCAWSVKEDAELFGLRMKTPLQVVAVTGASLLAGADQVVLNPSFAA
jgi:hypothetical protein